METIIKSFINIIIVGTLIVFSACQTSFGDKYFRDNLEVYFDEGTKPFAEPLADYFFDNHLVGSGNQSIMITSTSLTSEISDQYFILKMIQNDAKKKFDISETNQIELLEQDLEKKVFFSELEIVLCNSNFLEQP